MRRQPAAAESRQNLGPLRGHRAQRPPQHQRPRQHQRPPSAPEAAVSTRGRRQPQRPRQPEAAHQPQRARQPQPPPNRGRLSPEPPPSARGDLSPPPFSSRTDLLRPPAKSQRPLESQSSPEGGGRADRRSAAGPSPEPGAFPESCKSPCTSGIGQPGPAPRRW